MLGAEIGAQVWRAFPDASRVARAYAFEQGFHIIHAGFARHGGCDHLAQAACARRPHQGAGRNEVGEVKRRDACLFGGLHQGRCANGQIGFEGVESCQIIF